MRYAYQDKENLFLVLDLLTGGDLRFHIGRVKKFTEEQTKFFVACILIGLENLHSNKIIHRDIKPENLVLDKDGYVRITDLGVARILRPDNSSDTSGTPGYMAPEVMCRMNHSFEVDFYALGVIAYEFMLYKRPYMGRSRQEIRDAVLAKQVQVTQKEIPRGWSIEAADFINRMIQRKPSNRLGYNGINEIKNHPWLRNFPWIKLLNKEIQSPFIPKSTDDNYDKKHAILSSDDEETLDKISNFNLMLRRKSVQGLFLVIQNFSMIMNMMITKRINKILYAILLYHNG